MSVAANPEITLDPSTQVYLDEQRRLAADRAAALRTAALVPGSIEMLDIYGFRHFTRPEAIVSMREVSPLRTSATGEMAILILLDNRETFRVTGNIDQLRKEVFG